MFKRLFTSALLFGVAATAPPALAQQAQQMHCAPRDRVVARLEGAFAERMVANGLQTRNAMIEIWASADTGSFTILVTRADGLSCVAAAGRYFQLRDPEPEPPGAPS